MSNHLTMTRIKSLKLPQGGNPPEDEVFTFDNPCLEIPLLGPLDLEMVINLCDKTGGHLAGGALRDLLLLEKSSIKDFDIFFTKGVDIESAILNSPIPLKTILDGERLEKSTVRDGVTTIVKFKEDSLDYIVCNSNHIRDIVKDFDSSVCQIWMEKVNGEFHLFASKDFLEYLHQGAWYLYEDIPTSIGHIARLEAKFGPHTKKLSCKMEAVDLGKLSVLAKERKWITS